MNGLGSVGVAKGQDLSVIIIKGGKRQSASAYLALELVLSCSFFVSYCLLVPSLTLPAANFVFNSQVHSLSENIEHKIMPCFQAYAMCTIHN